MQHQQHAPPINSTQSRRRTPHSGKQKRAALQQQRRNDADRAAAPAPSEERGLCDLCAHLLVVSGPRVLLRLQFRFAQQLAAAAAAASCWAKRNCKRSSTRGPLTTSRCAHRSHRPRSSDGAGAAARSASLRRCCCSAARFCLPECGVRLRLCVLLIGGACCWCCISGSLGTSTAQPDARHSLPHI